ncbi:MAG: flippase-like domain-containing protein [Chloroflexi bacterium]|nr:flippase-like domain-containing protein [Chloroflexota bacterium]
MKKWQQWLLFAVGIAVSAIFLALALRGLNLREVWIDMRQARYGWLIPGVAVYFIAVWGRTWRWHYLLRPVKRISLKAMFPVVVIGYMGNNVYPLRAGEVIRAYVLKRNEDVSISASLATIIVERIFDGLVMLIFVFAALPFAPIPAPFDQIVLYMTGLFFGALLVFFLLALRPAFTRKLYTGIFNRLIPVEALRDKTIDLADRFMDGLASLRSPGDMLMILVTSVFIWLTETGKYWFVMHAFDFQVSFFVLMLMTAVVNLATTLPSSPGYVGTFHEPGIEILKVFGVPANTAAAYTVVLHAALWLPITLLGGFYMIRQGVRWRDFAEASRSVEQLNEADHDSQVPQSAPAGSSMGTR